MGLPKGHPAMPGGGRPKGSKNKLPTNKEKAEEMRQILIDAYEKRSEKLIEKFFKELFSLEGYTFIKAWEVYIKQILPSLQSISIDGELKTVGNSPLVEKILKLKAQFMS